MEKFEEKRKDFIAYEYEEIITDRKNVSLFLDGYENFGWETDENIYDKIPPKNTLTNQNKVILRLKRNRKIVNKMELTRLQRNFASCVREIEEMERRKTSHATMYALIIALIGTAFMAGSVFAVTAEPPHILLCILLAIPAFIGWILPYFVYRKTVEIQTKKVNPLIEEKYEEIYALCEKGNKLLH